MSFVLMLVSVFTFVQYNCENLFDCKHDSLKNDIEFTPEGSRRWTKGKYWTKLENISRAITSCGMDGNNWSCPDMVALCEIENDSVAFDLTHRTPLRAFGYNYIITNSNDLRGIDVALLWQPGSFKLICHKVLPITYPKGQNPTRDILYASGLIQTDDTLHVFVTHAPSRIGNNKHKKKYRHAVFERIAQAIDSIKAVCKNPRIIVAGDFNDTHDSPILVPLYNIGLQNVSAMAIGHLVKGTYKYKGKWENIDHIMLSNTLIPQKNSCYINDADFLLENDDVYGGVKPFRTAKGYIFQKGYSDHLPLVLRLNILH